MKKDLSIVKQILERFSEAEGAFISFKDLDERSPEEFLSDEQFVGHLLLVFEIGLISNMQLETSPLQKLGLHASRYGYDYANVQLRLTSEGHELLSALSKPAIFSQLQEQALNLPFETIATVAKRLLEKTVLSTFNL